MISFIYSNIITQNSLHTKFGTQSFYIKFLKQKGFYRCFYYFRIRVEKYFIILKQSTYRPVFSFILVCLLINVFIIKEFHFLLDHDHTHEHLHADKHSDCKQEAHFHTFSFASDCQICDFNFSPKEKTSDLSFSIPVIDFIHLSNGLYTQKIKHFFKDHENLRGPPLHFI